MRGLLSVSLLLLALLLATAAGKHRHHRKGHNKHDKAGGLECSTDTEYGKCVPESEDCGPGLREATCKDHTEKIHCSIPCNWKKDISDCKYKFGEWGPCDPETLTKSRSGTFKKAFFNAECQDTVKVSKPCATKPKKTRVPQEKTQ